MTRQQGHRKHRAFGFTLSTATMVLFSLASPLRFFRCGLPCLLLVLDGISANTVLYPVTEDARAAQQQQQSSNSGKPTTTTDASEPTPATAWKRQPGAPSRSLEYEGPGATYHIRIGTHPTISYPNLEDFPDTEIRIRYEYGNKRGIFEVDDCPRHFLWLSDKAVQTEVLYKFRTGRWSERVLVEKTYFTLFYGGTGLASQYMDSVDDFQTDLGGWEIMNRSANHCDWEGILCSNSTTAPQQVVGFQINGFSLEGTLPQDLYHLSSLKSLDLHGNRIRGSIPTTWGRLRELVDLDLGDNRLTGELPPTLNRWTNLERVMLGSNQLEGRLSRELLEAWTKREATEDKSKDDTQPSSTGLRGLDLSENRFVGRFPMEMLISHASDLESLDLSDNLFTGILPKEVVLNVEAFNRFLETQEQSSEGDDERPTARLDISQCTPPVSEDHPEDHEMNPEEIKQQQECIIRALEIYDAKEGIPPQIYAGLGKLKGLDLSRNRFTGEVPAGWMRLPSLMTLDLGHNAFSGSLPTEIWRASSLERLELRYNQLTGSIPSGDTATIGNRGWGRWSNMAKLKFLLLDNNQLTGTVPYELLLGLSPSLAELDLGTNQLEGSLPSSVGNMTRLEVFDVHGNRLTGKLPSEMNRLFPDVRLNLTDNFLIGTVPKIFCGGGAMSSNPLFRQFGCDAVLCPAGTFHPDGAASLYSGCRPCPINTEDDPLSAKILGQRRCGKDNNRTTFVHGDLNGDGTLSEREILSLLYSYTLGQNWGLQFESWADTSVDKCDLNGVVCVDGKVAKIDLTDASMCATEDRKAAPAPACKGIPAEISKLSQLEILTMNRRQFLRGTIPTEIGELTKMKYLDMSSCPMISGALPSEIGRLTDLKYLNIGGCRFNGTIPEELFELSKMEKLHLSMNAFTGTVPSSVEKMTNLKELLLSRTYVNGTIPESVGELVALENFELYGNQLVGTIPESLGRCSNLKRIDLFNNKLTGTIPESLADIRALQILHIKLNHLTGTISSSFGKLPSLSWFDVSTNHLHGTIPESFGHSKTLKDFRLGGGNMIHNPVPKSLCSNTNINGGLTKTYGCGGVICPLGTYSDPGHATHLDGCKRCPDGRTTTYLGSSRCIELTDEDILTMFYDVMAASNTFPMQEKHWAQGREGPVCTWNGVECDENETIETIWFPLLELNSDG